MNANDAKISGKAGVFTDVLMAAGNEGRRMETFGGDQAYSASTARNQDRTRTTEGKGI